VKDRVLDHATVTQMFYDDPLQQRWGHAGIPHAVRVDDHNRPAGTNAETWRFPSLHSPWTEQEPFAVQEFRKQLVEKPTSAIGGAKPARTHEDVA
jgi:hypothetical protein